VKRAQAFVVSSRLFELYGTAYQLNDIQTSLDFIGDAHEL
jgi:hypothetical protein